MLSELQPGIRKPGTQAGTATVRETNKCKRGEGGIPTHRAVCGSDMSVSH